MVLFNRAELRRTQPRALPGVPTMYPALLDAPGMKPSDFASLRYCISGGAPLPAQLKENGYSVTYYAPQPRAVLRIVHADRTDELMDYGQYGRVELTTMTKEFFVPRFLERDEAIRRPPCSEFPWDGVGDVRPFQSLTKTIIEGVY